MRVILNNFGYLPINARDLAIAVRNDEELNNFLSCETIDQGGMLSNIY